MQRILLMDRFLSCEMRTRLGFIFLGDLFLFFFYLFSSLIHYHFFLLLLDTLFAVLLLLAFLSFSFSASSSFISSFLSFFSFPSFFLFLVSFLLRFRSLFRLRHQQYLPLLLLCFLFLHFLLLLLFPLRLHLFLILLSTLILFYSSTYISIPDFSTPPSPPSSSPAEHYRTNKSFCIFNRTKDLN